MTKNNCKVCNKKRSKQALEDDIEWLLEDIKRLIEAENKILNYLPGNINPKDNEFYRHLSCKLKLRIENKFKEYVELEDKIKEIE